ncbi:MAG: hypothetical protein DRO07_02275 [Candidatus Iainarchaeum archaeon]|uniref:DOD-type homing endonuclease domain-containing protein n=1 Tax=Candidatus Iainarchaeum sp. TaxID=3101447 RepID=A0A497JGV0_9ARCH|nr:MAG: hypothetical protein DRO07_02275 [Candidatus Diapherotrites archaeon]
MLSVVKPKFVELFGVTPKIRKGSSNQIHCRIYSKDIFLFLSEDIGFPIGRKKNKLRVPSFIFKNKELSKAYIRGLFDTDGSIFRHHRFSAKIEITSHSQKFRKDIIRLLIRLGFKPIEINTHIRVGANQKLIVSFQ